LNAAIDAADGAADVRRSGPGKIAPGAGKGSKMKHVLGVTLRVGGCLVVGIAGVALLAGKDDIRKFRRMRNM
jgi:hypothetical protein